jgi:hypothetical protein
MSTSGQYNFSLIQNDKLITDAFERVGVSQNLVTTTLVESAVRSANLILSSWMNRGLNLWTNRSYFQTLQPDQPTYSLAPGFIDITEAFIRNLNRQLGGVAFSSEGIAANAFDGNNATACTQTNPNGNIGYDFGYAIAIRMVGVQSNVNRAYNLNFQASVDNLNWVTVYSTLSVNTKTQQNLWYQINSPINARYFRVIETGGAVLNIQELYFDRVSSDLPLSPVSREEYAYFPNKFTLGRPSCYCVNRQIFPEVTLWLTPSAQYTCLVYNGKKTIQDFGELINTPEIPQRFFDALCAGVAHAMALKPLPVTLTPDKLARLEVQAEKAFMLASTEDVEKYVSLKFEKDFSKYRVK